MIKRIKFVLCAAFLLQAGVLSAGGVYYRADGPNGSLLSNTPQPGAREIKLPPPSVIPGPKEWLSPATTDSASEKSDVYRSFSIQSPEDNGSLIVNPDTFEVRLASDPPLRIQDGHTFSLNVNNRPVGARFIE
jgi:hypothetical protein